MSLTKKVVKFNTYTQEQLDDVWVGHPQSFPADHPLFVDRTKIVCYGTIDDDQASYSYDDWALVTVNNKWYLLNTAGCSCPSPTETAGVFVESKTLSGLIKAFDKQKESYRPASYQRDQFLELFEFAKQKTKTKKGTNVKSS